MRGAGEVSGSRNPGRNPAAALLLCCIRASIQTLGGCTTSGAPPTPAPSPTRTQMGDLMLQQWEGAGGRDFFFFHFSTHLETRVQSQRGADSSKRRISQICSACSRFRPSTQAVVHHASLLLHWFAVLERPFPPHT